MIYCKAKFGCYTILISSMLTPRIFFNRMMARMSMVIVHVVSERVIKVVSMSSLRVGIKSPPVIGCSPE